jgi:predicted small lipoprotein YifL
MQIVVRSIVAVILLVLFAGCGRPLHLHLDNGRHDNRGHDRGHKDHHHDRD